MLEEKKTKDQEGVDADNLDYQHLRDLYSKGITQNARLSETRRAVLMSSQQLLQTVVEISNIERQRDEYGRQIEKIASQGRMDALRDLQAANLHLAEVKARLKTTGDKLMYAGLQSQLVQGTGGRPEIKVHRTGDSGPQDIVADEYLELSPGDVVEVILDAKRGRRRLLSVITRRSCARRRSRLRTRTSRGIMRVLIVQNFYQHAGGEDGIVRGGNSPRSTGRCRRRALFCRQSRNIRRISQDEDGCRDYLTAFRRAGRCATKSVNSRPTWCTSTISSRF